MSILEDKREYDRRWRPEYRLHRIPISARPSYEYFYDWGLEEWVYVSDDMDMGWTVECFLSENVNPRNRLSGELKVTLSGKVWKEEQKRILEKMKGKVWEIR